MSTASRSPLDSLADPAPPTPDAATRAAVQERAHQILRRRRFALGAGTLACTAVLAVGVVALAGSSSDPGRGTTKVEAASTPDAGTTVTTPAPTTAPTTVPAPAAEPAEPTPAAEVPTTAEAPVSTPAPAAEAEPPTPVPTSLTVTVGGAPAGVTIEVTITGPSGDITGTTTTGSITFTDLAPGTYEVFWSWQTDDGASAVGRGTADIGEGAHTIAL